MKTLISFVWGWGFPYIPLKTKKGTLLIPRKTKKGTLLIPRLLLGLGIVPYTFQG